MSASQMFNLDNKKLISERKTFICKLTYGYTVISASAGGVVSGAIQLDPTVTSYTEAKSLTTLYTSYRLKSARLRLGPESGNTTKRGIYFASFLATGLGTPTSYAQVCDNANWFEWANVANDNTGRPKMICIGGDVKLGFQEWGTTATDVSGAPGGFYFYGDGFTASQPVFNYMLEVIFEVRNRA